MYGSHDMRHTGFRRLTVVIGTPGFWGVTPRNWENEFLWVIANKGKSFSSITRKIAWGATIYNLWGHRNRRIQENNYAPADTIFRLICDDVRLRISGIQKVVDSPANRSMCDR